MRDRGRLQMVIGIRCRNHESGPWGSGALGMIGMIGILASKPL